MAERNSKERRKTNDTGNAGEKQATRATQGSSTRGGLNKTTRQDTTPKKEADDTRRRRGNSSGGDGNHGGNR